MWDSKYKRNVAGAAILLLACVMIYLARGINTPQVIDASVTTQKQNIKFHNSDHQNKKASLATAWQAGKPSSANVSRSDENNSPVATGSVSFDEVQILEALNSLKLDEQGDVVFDNVALLALGDILEKNYRNLDGPSLIELSALIKRGLHGNAGEQIAQVAADYFNYLNARDEYYHSYEPTDNLATNRSQFEELKALRELHLGGHVANQLFELSDANANYMFDSMLLEKNNHLNEAEKQQQQAGIIQRHLAETIGVVNWNTRYPRFLADKQHILNADLNASDKRMQVNLLMPQHFTAQELEKVDYLNLGEL